MTTDASRDGRPPGPFSDLDAFVGLPRLAGLRLSPAGDRLVVGVSAPDHDQVRYTSALWEVDPTGTRQARRLTRSDKGESGAALTPSGDLLFVSKRPAPTGHDENAGSALWLQPAAGGDARVVANLPGGGRGVVVSASGTVVVGSNLMPSAADPAADEEIRKARKDGAVTAILHDEFPIRFWDHDLGPDRTRLLVGDLTEDVTAGEADLTLRDITGHVGMALHDDSTWQITPDGGTVVASWTVPEPGGSQRPTVMAIDVATGRRTVLADDPALEFDSPELSPDGTTVSLVATTRTTPTEPSDSWLAVVPVTGGEVRDLTRSWDRWPGAGHWTPDGSALVLAADDLGHAPLWRVDAVTGETTKLTGSGAFSDVQVCPDGRFAYALRSAVDSPPTPVRVALDGPPSVQPLLGPAEAFDLPGTLTEVTTTAEDGSPLRAWLAVPSGAGPDAQAPLLLWVHGGPLSSWNKWSWRWNPWLAVAQGYAVLLPDPALSTGYGMDFVRRGWGRWGAAPYTDVMTATDAAVAREDIDAGRTAAMGGSFGGYMANWIAGHTDRFAAIVTHASLWSLDQFAKTSDAAYFFEREMAPELVEEHSPDRYVDDIVTPMLVVHGDKDYRVPIGEGLRLWWDLSSRARTEDGGAPHRFLYFPDENHWVLTPNHAKVWYSTVFAFLAQHVLGEEWQRPTLLG